MEFQIEEGNSLTKGLGLIHELLQDLDVFPKLVIAHVIMLCILCPPHDALGKVYIDIDSPGFQKFSHSYCRFQDNRFNRVLRESCQVGFQIPWRVSGDDGLLNIISKKAFLEDQKQDGLNGRKYQVCGLGCDWR